MKLSRISHSPITCAFLLLTGVVVAAAGGTPNDSSPMRVKAAWFQQDLLDKHWLDGLYVSIVPSAPPGTKFEHTVEEPGNVIHAGVWTGRYLAGVGYQYAITRDPWVRRHGGEILQALRILQEVTGKAGLLARGYVKGHGPVEDWERNGADSKEWHQGQGTYADYRWYGDVSVDNFNAVLYGYAIYYDLAADAGQKKIIARDVERLMAHLLDNHCRIIDVDGEVTQWGHVGMDPDPGRDEYYQKVYARYLQRTGATNAGWQPPLRSSLMLLPDLLIADHITGNPRYRELYRRTVARFKDNPDLRRDGGPFSLERVARVNHSSEGQAYEALYNLVRYERDPALLTKYRGWVTDLWEMNWMEGNSLFAFMTLALLPEYRAPLKSGLSRATPSLVPHGNEGLGLARETLRDFPLDRVLRPVMNSLRADLERNPSADRGKEWRNVSAGLMGASVQNICASTNRTFVMWAKTDRGVVITRDGGLSWRAAPESDHPEFPSPRFHEWQAISKTLSVRVNDAGALVKTSDGGQTTVPCMEGWRIPGANSVFITPWGVVAGGPGGCYLSADAERWTEMKLWRNDETGAADFLHAYWMGRYYGFIGKKD